jgi:hypothetical protein
MNFVKLFGKSDWVANWDSEGRQEGTKEATLAAFRRQRTTLEKPSAIFQTVSVGNSSSCIKKGVFEGYGYSRSLSTPYRGAAVHPELARSVLPSLELAATRNTGRILMHSAA